MNNKTKPQKETAPAVGCGDLLGGRLCDALIQSVQVCLENIARLWKNRKLVNRQCFSPQILLVLVVQCLFLNINVSSASGLDCLNRASTQGWNQPGSRISNLFLGCGVERNKTLLRNPAFGDRYEHTKLILGLETSLPASSQNTNGSGDNTTKDGKSGLFKGVTHILFLGVCFLGGIALVFCTPLADWLSRVGLARTLPPNEKS